MRTQHNPNHLLTRSPTTYGPCLTSPGPTSCFPTCTYSSEDEDNTADCVTETVSLANEPQTSHAANVPAVEMKCAIPIFYSREAFPSSIQCLTTVTHTTTAHRSPAEGGDPYA